MTQALPRLLGLTIAIVACCIAIDSAQGNAASWLDETKPASWNSPGAIIPAAPRREDTTNSRCRDLARPAQLDEDKRVQAQGWDLIGAFQGGWQLVVIRAAAGYDGMCRPQPYQDFVFVRGVFAGTLSPHAMNSRADGSLVRVTVQNQRQLMAEYVRYAENDPLCCPSRTTIVEFNIDSTSPTVQPVSATTSKGQVSR